MGCAGGKEDQVYLIGLQVFRTYDFVMLLGKGATSQVHEAVEKSTGQSFAIKCVVKQEADRLGRSGPVLESEVQRWKALEHPNICQLHATFEDRDLHYFVMEMCEGGTFFEKLEEEIVLEEAEAGRIGFQMISAVAHMHDKGICHRDLKPESWLLSQSSPQARMKLINFGLAEQCQGDEDLTHPCGTLHYLAPEVLRGRYGKQVDTWTLGIVLFLAIYAAYPFDGPSCPRVMQSILSTEPDWSDTCYALSAEARDLLHQLLLKDPRQRPSAQQAMGHRWFSTVRSRPSMVGSARGMESRKSQAKFRTMGSKEGFGNIGPRRSLLVTGDMVSKGLKEPLCKQGSGGFFTALDKNLPPIPSAAVSRAGTSDMNQTLSVATERSGVFGTLDTHHLHPLLPCVPAEGTS